MKLQKLITKPNFHFKKLEAARGVILKRGSENMQQIYLRTPMPKCDYANLSKSTSAWVFSIKFTAYFQNSFS